MWLLHPDSGFFSVVCFNGDPNVLTVRARARGDLDVLRETYLPELTATELDTTGDRDYPARGHCLRTDWAEAVKAMALDIDYTNFKDAVARRQGNERAHVYHDVWDALVDLERLDPTPGRTGPWRPATRRSVEANDLYPTLREQIKARIAEVDAEVNSI